MKKNLFKVLLILLLLPVKVFAEGYISVSPESLTIEQGSSKTFTITAYNAIGDVTIVSNNNGIASTNITEWGTDMVDEKQTKTETVTVTGNSVGTTTITINIDAATYDGDDLSGQTRTIKIDVVAKQDSSSTDENTTGVIEGKDENVENPKTGDVFIYIIVIVGIVAFCYGVFYFYKLKINNKQNM